MKGGKFVALGVALLLIAGIVIVLVTCINNNKNESKTNNEDRLSTTSNAVSSICSHTDYKQTCISTMGAMSKNRSASPKDFLQHALRVAVEEIEKVMSVPPRLGKDVNNSREKMAVADCLDLLQYAKNELKDSFSAVGASSLVTITHSVLADLKNWLSAVLSYQETCVDGFTTPELRRAISKSLVNATMLVDNALAIVGALSQIIQSFNNPNYHPPPAPAPVSSRKLLQDGFPEWLPAVDRKLLVSRANPAPNAIVAKDGSGQFKTLSAALAAYPKNQAGRYVIYVKEGVYDDYVTMTKKQVNVYIYGDGPRKSIITGNKSFKDGFSTFKTPTFSALGDGLICRSIGFQNTAGAEGHQAVALQVQSDKAAFYNCRIDGYQDTLYVHTHRQFYRNCVISGTIDFIFGDAAVVIQNCLIIVRMPMEDQENTVTAQGRTQRKETTGIVIQNCRIVPEKKLDEQKFKIATYLGRPWKPYSKTIIMETTIGDFIRPAGWMPWSGTFALDTLYYREYNNRGPGAKTDRRVKWKGYRVITERAEALQFTAAQFIQGTQWLQSKGIPYFLGLKN